MHFIFLLLFLFKPLFSQTLISENRKIEQFIHIWGLVKYQHPDVSKGVFNFNEEFVKELNNIENVKTQEELNMEFVSWINFFTSSKTKFYTDEGIFNSNNIFNKNVDFKWIETSKFSIELVELLNKIKNNTTIGDYYASINSLNNFINYKNEKGIDNFDSSKISHRLLFLSSFWNVMNFWNVNLYLTDTPWSEVLIEMIPDFIEKDNIKFEYAKDKLFSKLNDSHANYESSYLINKVLTKFPPFVGKIINDSLVVTQLNNIDLSNKDNINLGDVIYSVEGKTLKQYYTDKFSNVVSASTNNWLKRRIENYFILASDKDSVQVEIRKKNGIIVNKYIKLYKLNSYPFQIESLYKLRNENWKEITDNIGYINLNSISKSELKKAFLTFENTKGIIIDLRNYPKEITPNDIANFIYPEKKIFLKLLRPIFPSYGEYDAKVPLGFINNPFEVGSVNKDYYKGKIVLLVDRKTGSNAEYIGMAIQQAPNCITIGEPTFGAVLNRNTFTLSDKTTIDYTGMGAFYPNGDNVQRKGLKIDYEIKESAINFNSNIYNEKAIQFIQTNFSKN